MAHFVKDARPSADRSVEDRIRAAFRYDRNTGAITRITASGEVPVTTLFPNGYVRVNFDGRSFLGHRLAWLLETGQWPTDEIDHINMVKDDNKWANLREADRSENLGNREAYSNNTSGLKGVYFDARLGNWRSSIQRDGKRRSFGPFGTPEEAHAAYTAASKETFGEYARSTPEKARGDWLLTFTGKQFFPMDPKPEDICIEDIAHGLSLLCRFAGQCTTFYSVAEHSLHVERAMKTDDVRMRLGALLHDAAEAYIVDIPRPVKHYLPHYGQIELNVEVAIAEKFDLYWPIKQPAIASLDNRILLDERDQIMTQSPHAWGIEGKPLGVRIHGYHPQLAESQFLRRFNELWEALPK